MKEDLAQVAQVQIGDELTIYYNLFNCNTVVDTTALTASLTICFSFE
jgi:hypothetical protein